MSKSNHTRLKPHKFLIKAICKCLKYYSLTSDKKLPAKQHKKLVLDNVRAVLPKMVKKGIIRSSGSSPIMYYPK